MIIVNKPKFQFPLPKFRKCDTTTLILQNTFNKKIYIFDLEESDCPEIEFPECFDYGMYQYWISNRSVSIEDLNRYDIDKTILTTGLVLSNKCKFITINSNILVNKFSYNRLCILYRGLLRYDNSLTTKYRRNGGYK